MAAKAKIYFEIIFSAVSESVCSSPNNSDKIFSISLSKVRFEFLIFKLFNFSSRFFKISSRIFETISADKFSPRENFIVGKEFMLSLSITFCTASCCKLVIKTCPDSREFLLESSFSLSKIAAITVVFPVPGGP